MNHVAGQFNAGPDTISTLAELNTGTAIWKKDDHFYRVYLSAAADEQEYEGVDKTSSCSDDYTGSARVASKTSWSSSSWYNNLSLHLIPVASDLKVLTLKSPPPYLHFTGLDQLSGYLKPDSFMRLTGLNNSSDRNIYEQMYVLLDHISLKAIKREDDNDYHLIMQDNTDSTSFLTCEITGLPSDTSAGYSAFRQLRQYIQTYFGTDFCGRSSYTIFTPAIPVDNISGTMFYDIDHLPGTIGPAGYRPSSAWEIHPVRSLRFKKY